MVLRFLAAFLAAVITFSAAARAQQAAPAMALGGVTLGETIAAVRDKLGDPLGVKAEEDGQSIWRYLDGSGSYYIDLLVKNYAVASVTILARFHNSAFVDDRGVAFGKTAAAVRTQLGVPAHENTNADDGSLDLWYAEQNGYRIYEFVNDKLGFVQIVVPHFQPPAGPAVTPGDGSSFERAVRVVAPNMLAGSAWIGAYVAGTPCGNGGHYVEATTAGTGDLKTHDNVGYIVTPATCSVGGAQRDFYFDASRFFLAGLHLPPGVSLPGFATAPPGTSSGPQTIYVDVSTLRGAAPAASPSASAPPAAAASTRGGTSFADAIVIDAPSEMAGVKAEYVYLAAHPCDGGMWHMGKQALVTHDNIPYDVLSVACTNGGASRDFYFDIRSFFGK